MKFWSITICYLLRCFGLNKRIQLSVFFVYPLRFLRNAVPTRPDNRGSILVKMRAVIEKETALIMHQIVLVIILRGFR